jgi:hypothetical protein
MLATKVLCPHCRKHLKMTKPPAAGHRILCPRCGRSFPAPVGPAGMPEVESPVLQPDAVSPAGKPDLRKLWIGMILGGLVFLLTATLGLALYIATRKTPEDVAVETAAASPTGEIPPSPEPSRQDSRLLPESPVVATSTEAKQELWLPPGEQEKVNRTIERGVQWLKKNEEQATRRKERLGLTALPALTLLECGVPPDDIHIQKALHHIRQAIPTLNQTYDLSLAILFLDRLGDPADKKRIQTCALRLAAGQMASGGWTYDCPLLSPAQEEDLLTVMRARRPRDTMDLFVGGKDGSAPPGFLARDASGLLDKGANGDPSGDSKLLPEGGVFPLEETANGKPLEKARPSPEAAKRAFNHLSIPLRKIPSLQAPKQAHNLPRRDNSDNSNTQFAILGMLAASRHDLPLERVGALIVHRFHRSQVADGRWNYHFSSPARAADLRPAMTGAGLLGLAVQYGLAADQAQPSGKPRHIDDPAVEKGFHYLAQFIGKPIGWRKTRVKNREPINLYLLWTVERCGVLYNRRHIEGKDWYSWGVELLLDHQNADGSWALGNYYGSQPVTDTSFALLFLKRANLAKELTKKVEFFMEGKKLQTTP